jgi:polysaccharide biosynthesis transport protein
LDFITLYYDARRLWWLILLIFAGSLGLGYLLYKSRPPQFSSEAKMVLGGKISIDAGSAYTEERADFLGTQAAVMQGDEVFRRATKSLADTGMAAPTIPVDLRASFIPRTEIFLLDATGTGALYTQSFLRAAIKAFFDLRKEMRDQQSESAQSAVSAEVVRVQKELDNASQKLIDFQRQFSVVSLEEDVTATTAYLETLHKRIADLRLQRSVAAIGGGADPIAAGAAIPLGDNANGDTGVNANATGQPQDRLLAAQQDLAIQQTERNRLLENLKPQHPRIKQLDIKIAEDKRLIELFNSQSKDRHQEEITAIDRETEGLEKEVQQKQDHLLEINNNLAQYQSLKSAVDNDRETYNKLIAGMQNIDVGKQVGQEPITILEDPSQPRLVPNPIGVAVAEAAVVGLGLGFGLIALWSHFAPRFQTVSAVKKAVGLPIYGKILRDRSMSSPRTVLDCDSHQLGFAESFRNLRSCILNQPEAAESQRCFAVTSAIPLEGKSTVSANVAIALAASNSRVLLIDGDLRRGRLHEPLRVNATHGLSNLLAGKSTLNEVLYSTRMQDLILLPCGPSIPNGTELLLRFAFEDLMQELQRRFDYVIIDTPPVLAVDDALTLAARVNWTMFVVRLNYTRPAQALSALDELSTRRIKVAGVVVNGAPVGQTAGNYYNYYYRGLEQRPFLESGVASGELTVNEKHYS